MQGFNDRYVSELRRDIARLDRKIARYERQLRIGDKVMGVLSVVSLACWAVLGVLSFCR